MTILTYALILVGVLAWMMLVLWVAAVVRAHEQYDHEHPE